MKLIIVLLVLLCLIIIYRNYKEYYDFKETYTEVNFLPRKLVGNAMCMKDDTEVSSEIFKCTMSNKYSPVNVNITTVKYRNFTPDISGNLQNNKLILNTLTPSVTPSPNFSDDDFKLIGTTTDPVTDIVTLNNYKKLMKVTNFGSNYLFSDYNSVPIVETSSLEDNNFLYLPDCVKPYLNYLNDMNLLQPFIDINKIDSINNIATQFQSYLKGLLTSYTKPDSNFRLEREIIIIFTSDKKNIVNIKFNQTLSYFNSNNVYKSEITSTNINTGNYDYFIINSIADSGNTTDFISPIKIYGNALKSRQLIDDVDINALLDKINNIKSNNILYINYFVGGIQLVKRVSGQLISMNYFEIPNFNYYKNMCPDPANDFYYKGRCYSKCPSGYTNLGLTCVLNNEANSYEINKLFDPSSNFCKQLCERSYDDISKYEQVMQQACWCESMSCNKCGEYSIGQCNC